MDEKLILTEEWDKTFPESGKVKHRKVTFRSRFGITLAAACTSRRSTPAGFPLSR